MIIDHIAVWSEDIEVLKDFYIRFFEAKANDKYINSQKGFESYFLTFSSGAQLEIMQRTDISSRTGNPGDQYIGITHFAFKLDSEQQVDELTQLLKKHGVTIAGEPRRTGDGFYESVILDPDGNQIELVG